MAAGFKTATVDSASVDATLTDYPSNVDLSRLGITTLAEAQSVRVYTDVGKTTELAREIVSASLMYVKIPSLTTSTSIYVDWDGVRSDYAVSATYGRNNVWTNYGAVYHMNDTTSTLVDSTGTNDGTMAGTLPNATAAQLGDGQDFNGTTDQISVSDDASIKIAAGDFTVQYWMKTTSTLTMYPFHYAAGDAFADEGLIVYKPSGASGKFRTLLRNGIGQDLATGTIEINDDDWHSLTSRRVGTTVAQFVDGTADGTVTSSKNVSGSFDLYIGSGNGEDYTDGILDEMRVINDAGLSDDWITTEHNNQSDETTFWGTWTDAGGGGPTATPFSQVAIII